MHLLHTIFFKLNFIAKYVNNDVLQQGLPMNVVPHWIETKGRMRMVSLRPRYPTMHFSAFRIFKSEECLLVKNWSKIVNDRREVIMGSNQKRNP